MTESMTVLEKRNILAQICAEAMTENQAWFTQGCRLAEFVSFLRDLSIPFELKDLQALPNIQLGKDGTIRLRSAAPQHQPSSSTSNVNVKPYERKRKLHNQDNHNKPSPSGPRRKFAPLPETRANDAASTEAPVETPQQQQPQASAAPAEAAAAVNIVDESKLVQYETQALLDYVKLHYVGESQAHRINRTVSLLQRYLDANFQSGLCVSLHLVGSYASGLASKTRSEIDVYVRLDGGDLTEVLDSEGLAEALEVALQGCPYFACTPRRGQVVLGVIDHSFRLTLRPFNVNSFPFAHLQHAALIASLNRSSPVVSVFVSIVKAWAAQQGILEILGSFAWTVLCIGYLKSRELINENPAIHPQSPQQPAAATTTPFDPLLFGREFLAFLLWTASTDLLSVSVSCRGVEASLHRGWLSILDPVTGANIAPIRLSHRDTIRASFSIRQAAKSAIMSFRRASE